MTLYPNLELLRRHVKAAIIAAACMFIWWGLTGLALAQVFKPQKPIEFLVHTGPGGGNDVMARAISGFLEKERLLPVRTVVVNKPGGGERISALLGGHAQLYVADAGEIREYTRNGSARVIAQLVDKRMPSLPDVPTIKEAGYSLPIINSLRGAVGPPGIGREVVEYWENVFERLTKSESWRRYLADNQLEDGFEKSAQLAKTAEELIAQRRIIYKEAGITMYR
jgi:tripartite-type tricarboxylate transporter receptor subunit TctC